MSPGAILLFPRCRKDNESDRALYSSSNLMDLLCEDKTGRGGSGTDSWNGMRVFDKVRVGRGGMLGI